MAKLEKYFTTAKFSTIKLVNNHCLTFMYMSVNQII